MERTYRWLLMISLVLVGSPLFADDGPEPPSGDFRFKVMLAYATVFGAVLVYLFLSHRRNARIHREVELLEERVEELAQDADQ